MSASRNGQQNQESHAINVNILDKDYQVACPADEQDQLYSAARKLDEQMRMIRTTGKVIGVERIAIMAALNITHEYLQTQNQLNDKDTEQLLKRVNRKLDTVLNDTRQLEM